MLLGAMLDAGVRLERLLNALENLGLADIELMAETVTRRGLTGIKFDVIDRGAGRPAHNLGAIRDLVMKATLPESVIERSLSVFEALAEAEASVHGTSVDQVHFHEVGAVDSIVDVVGFCWAMEELGLERMYASPLPLGTGTVTTAHGLLPVPAPATLELLARASAPTVPTTAEGELVTPTGAALLSVCASFTRPAMAIQRVGYGFGTKEFPWANVLRIWIGEEIADRWAPRQLAGGEAGHTHGDPHDHTQHHEHGERAPSHQHSHEETSPEHHHQAHVHADTNEGVLPDHDREQADS